MRGRKQIVRSKRAQRGEERGRGATPFTPYNGGRCNSKVLFLGGTGFCFVFGVFFFLLVFSLVLEFVEWWSVGLGLVLLCSGWGFWGVVFCFVRMSEGGWFSNLFWSLNGVFGFGVMFVECFSYSSGKKVSTVVWKRCTGRKLQLNTHPCTPQIKSGSLS